MADKGVELKFSVSIGRPRCRIMLRGSVACRNLNKSENLEDNSFSLLFCSVNI